MFYLNFIKKAFFLVEKKDFIKILKLLFLTLLTSFAELISIGLVIPILNLFVGNNYLDFIKYFNFIELTNKNDFLILILFLFGLAHLIKFFLNRLLIFSQNEFSQNFYVKVSKYLFNDYLNKNYSFYINKNSSELTRNIMSEAFLYSSGVIFHYVRLFSELIVFVSLTILLLFYNYQITLITIGFFSIFGYFFYKSNAKILKEIGKKRQYHTDKIFKRLKESFSGFRELILNKLQKIFYDNYLYHAKENAFVAIKKDNTVALPRLILELITIFVLILIIIFLILNEYDISEIFILLGVFLYTTIRILPSVAKIVQSAQSIKFNESVVDVIYTQLNDKINNKSFEVKNERYQNKTKLNFENIIFKDVSFYYKKENLILNDINLKITNNNKIGIIGQSGSGKSTFINLFCGLLEPTNGHLTLDKDNYEKSKHLFQEYIGYVPQNVTIFDESVIFNIALENQSSKVDLQRIKKILKEVKLDEVVNNLPNKEFEMVGENGAKLSGGQCQRLGIARVLYRNPSIIVFDEATSALDDETEKHVLDALFNNYENKTIILSTHRTKPLKYCDIIYEIKDKKLLKIEKNEDNK